jgi:primosomal protein N'
MYYRVIPFKRTFDTYGLIYNAPKELFSDIAPGKIVIVPFRDTEELALCVSEVAESELNCETENIKNIISVF